MVARNTYDQQLRAIGQSLESRRIELFELKRQDDRFVVNGTPEHETSLLGILRGWQGWGRNNGSALSLSYATPDIENLERQGAAKRVTRDRLPDFYSVSNTLRTLGSYLELQGAELLEIHKQALTVKLVYRNRHGFPDIEERSISSFYHLFIHLHGRRRKAKG